MIVWAIMGFLAFIIALYAIYFVVNNMPVFISKIKKKRTAPNSGKVVVDNNNDSKQYEVVWDKFVIPEGIKIIQELNNKGTSDVELNGTKESKQEVLDYYRKLINENHIENNEADKAAALCTAILVYKPIKVRQDSNNRLKTEDITRINNLLGYRASHSLLVKSSDDGYSVLILSNTLRKQECEKRFIDLFAVRSKEDKDINFKTVSAFFKTYIKHPIGKSKLKKYYYRNTKFSSLYELKKGNPVRCRKQPIIKGDIRGNNAASKYNKNKPSPLSDKKENDANL